MGRREGGGMGGGDSSRGAGLCCDFKWWPGP